MRKRVALAAFVMLGACGQKSALQPVEGAALPPAPYGAAVQPTADELLAVEPTAAPDRSVSTEGLTCHASSAPAGARLARHAAHACIWWISS